MPNEAEKEKKTFCGIKKKTNFAEEAPELTWVLWSIVCCGKKGSLVFLTCCLTQAIILSHNLVPILCEGSVCLLSICYQPTYSSEVLGRSVQ